MRRLIPFAVATLALVVASSASTATTTVSIKDTAFAPSSITINFEDSVTWKNDGKNTHQVVANSGTFASPILAAGKSYTFKFTQSGTFNYHDSLHPSLKGKVTVKGPPPTLTFAASVPVVKYGAPVTLSGTVSTKKTGEKVTLVQLPAGQTTKQVIATLQTAAGGTFSFAVTPQVATVYQAQWSTTESSVTVQVMPMIKLPRPVRGFFHFYVTAANSASGQFAGHTVFLQRWSPAQGKWISFRTLLLGSRSGRIFPVSYAPRHARTALRIFLPQDQAGAGYLETTSGSQPVTRR